MNILALINSLFAQQTETRHISAAFSETVVNHTARTARTRVVFSEAIRVASFSTFDILARGTAGVDYTIAAVGSGETATEFNINWTLPRTGGYQTIAFTTNVSQQGVIQPSVQDASGEDVVVDYQPSRFVFSSAQFPALAVTSSLSQPSTRTFQINLTFAESITNFTTSDLYVEGGTFTLTGNSNNWTVTVNAPSSSSAGKIRVRFADNAQVTVAGANRSPVLDVVEVYTSYNLYPAANATMVVGTVASDTSKNDDIQNGTFDVTLQLTNADLEFESLSFIHFFNVVNGVYSVRFSNAEKRILRLRVTPTSNAVGSVVISINPADSTLLRRFGAPTRRRIVADPLSVKFSTSLTPPTDFKGVVEAKRIKMSWKLENATPDSYQIRFSKMSDFSDNPTWVNVGNVTEYTTQEFSPSTLYSQLRAVYPSGQSFAVNAGPFTILPGIPTTLSAPENASTGVPFTVNITFGVDVSSFPIGSISASNGGVSNLRGSGKNWAVTVTPRRGYSGVMVIFIDSNTVVTASGVKRSIADADPSRTVNTLTDRVTILSNSIAAALTPPSATIKSRTFTVDCRFEAVVSDFTTSDVTLEGDNSDDLTLNSIVAKPGGDTGRDYVLNMSIAADKVGVASIDITGLVTRDSQRVSVTVGSNRMLWDTRSSITATFGTAVVDNVKRTATIRVTFARAIQVVTFTTSDLQIATSPVLTTSAKISQVNTGATDTEFDIVVSLPEDETGTLSYDISGRVREGTIDRTVKIDEGSTEFSTFPSSITPTMKGQDGTKTGNFSVNVNFANTGVSGFDSADVSIKDISGVSASVVSLGAGVYRIDFSGLPTQSTGKFSLDLIGSVQISMQGSRSITFDAVTITYDTRTPITATWGNDQGIKTDDFDVSIDFEGTDAVNGLEKTDVEMLYVSGDTLATAGVLDYTLEKVDGTNDWVFKFTPAEGVSGVFSLDITGQVLVGASGSQVSRPVSIATTQISYNTTGSAVTPGTAKALVAISPPEAPLGVFADQPIAGAVTYDIVWDRDTGTDFTHSDIIIHESTAAGPFNPLSTALANVGTAGTTTHWRLTYTPPKESHGEVYIEVAENAISDLAESLPGYSAPVAFDTRPPRTIPEPIWTVPDGIITDNLAPFDVDINFGEDVIGFTATDFIVEGVQSQLTLLYRIVNGEEVLHDDDTPASQFRLKTRIIGERRGILSFILLQRSILTQDDNTFAPITNSQSPPIQYDTIPMPEPEPEPVYASWVAFPTMITESRTDYSFDIQFDREVSGLQGIGFDFDIFGLDSNRLIIFYKVINGVESIHVDPTESASLYRIKVQVFGQQEGIVWLSMKMNSVTASDDGVGPPTSITSPGVPYDTIPEPEPEPEPEEPASVEIGLPERPVGTYATQPISEAITIDITWSEDFEGFAGSAIEIYETGSGPHNALSTNLANVGTTGTFTNFRLTYTPPENSKGIVNFRVPAGLYKDNEVATSHSIAFDTLPEPEPEVSLPVIDSWDVSKGNRFAEPFVFTATFDKAIANTAEELRTSLDIEGADIDVMDTNAVGIEKATDNLSVTITITPEEGFTGIISVGIEEDDLRNVE